MKLVEKNIQKVDDFQQGHRLPGFVYAVVKKYSDDNAGYQAALLTYYGFLSLFPLLLVLATIAGIVARSDVHLQTKIVTSVTGYFPVLGNQLADNIRTLHKSGLPLVIGILFMIYGARGVAGAFQHGVNHIWQVPRRDRAGFPRTVIKSLSLIIIGGLGLLAASVLATLTAGVGHGILFRLLSLMVSLVILFLLFTVLINLSLPKHVVLKETRAGAAAAAIGLVVLQSAGGYLLTRELKNLSALYSYFALALGLLFWIYLQAQMLYYAVEVASVSSRHLWPRSLSGKKLTPADKRVYASLAAQERVLPLPEERIKTSFTK